MEELPELPNPQITATGLFGAATVTIAVDYPIFTADQMRSYAEQAVREERERCAKCVEDADCPSYRHGGQTYDDVELFRQNIAAAIRKDTT